MGLTTGYIIRRLLVFLVIVWAAASLNFLIPRLAPGDPIGAMLSRMSLQGMKVENSAEMIAAYRERFGLNGTLFEQYIKYLWSTLRLDMGFSLANFPVGVMTIIQNALPWTIALLATATLISFVLGTLLGALMAWRGSPRAVQIFSVPLMVLAGIPYYLLAMMLLYLLAFGVRIFPTGGLRTTGADASLSLNGIVDVLYHSFLPALSLVLASIGGWMLGMRGMMVTVAGSDYMNLAKAKGLRNRRIFLRYGIRNAILPQITSLAISLGGVASGAVLVEVIFSYPGIGFQLYRAISNADYTTIQGITFILVVSVAVAVLILDLIYPRLDPRITYSQK
jgi:peptide/nickel transport system permease protein